MRFKYKICSIPYMGIATVHAQNGNSYQSSTFQGLVVSPSTVGFYDLIRAPVHPRHTEGGQAFLETVVRSLVAGSVALFPTVFKTAAQQNPRLPYIGLWQKLGTENAWLKGSGVNIGLGAMTRTGMFYLQDRLETCFKARGASDRVSIVLATTGTVGYETFMQSLVEANLSRVLAKEGHPGTILMKQMRDMRSKGVPGFAAVGARNFGAWLGWTMIPAEMQTIMDKQNGIHNPDVKHKPGFGAMGASGILLYGLWGTPLDVLKQCLLSHHSSVSGLVHNLTRRTSWAVKGGAELSIPARALELSLKRQLKSLVMAIEHKDDLKIADIKKGIQLKCGCEEFSIGVKRRLQLLEKSYVSQNKMSYINAFKLALAATGLPPTQLLFRSALPRMVMGLVTLSSLLGVNVGASLIFPNQPKGTNLGDKPDLKLGNKEDL